VALAAEGYGAEGGYYGEVGQSCLFRRPAGRPKGLRYKGWPVRPHPPGSVPSTRGRPRSSYTKNSSGSSNNNIIIMTIIIPNNENITTRAAQGASPAGTRGRDCLVCHLCTLGFEVSHNTEYAILKIGWKLKIDGGV
jgi:hypothetical protein